MNHPVLPVSIGRNCVHCGADSYRRARYHRRRGVWSFQCIPCCTAANARLRADPCYGMLIGARGRAAKAGVKCTITLSYLHSLIPPDGRCPAFGTLFSEGGMFAMSLDRIDPALGYVPGNVWIICRLANVMKNKGTPWMLRRLADAIDAQLARPAVQAA